MNIYSVMVPRQSRINLGVEFKCPKQKQRRKVSNVPKQGNCIRYVRRVELLSDHLPIKNIGQNNVAKLVHHFYGNPISPDFLL